MKIRALTDTDGRVAARAAAVASIGAATIHLAVAPGHWSEWLPSGLFFASVAVFQLLWAFLAWTRPPAALLAAGIAVNTGLAALWVLSRTAVTPLGPNTGHTEAIRAAGICALLLECYVIMGAGWAWLRNEERAQPVSGISSALVLFGANTLVAVAATVGLASGLQRDDHGAHRAPAEAEGPTTENAESVARKVSSPHQDAGHPHDE